MTPDPSETNSEVSAVLVDDHDLFRGGLKEILQDQGISVVGEASDGEHGVELVAELAPDVVVMDLNMPGIGGVEATRQVATRMPATNVLVLTISSDDDSIMRATMARACGYLLKDASVEELVAGIEAAAAGESSISPKIAAKVLGWLREGQADRRAPESVRADLSEREIDVLRLLAAGKGNAEIAEELF